MNYTQAQIDRANAVSLEDFLRTQGETLIKSGREYRWKEHDSLTVRGNKWFRHSQSKGGYPIDFVIPTDKRLDILNALERIGFFPAYGGVRTMQQIMEKSVPGSGPQFYFVFRENELIGYNFLIGDTKKYKAFPWLAISNMDEQKLTVCEELMKIQIAFFEELGMQKIADHCVRIMEDYRKGIGKQKESDCR